MRRSTNKYGARRTVALGRHFDSRAEADRGVELTLLEQAGEIQDLVFQPRLELEPGIFYKPDFGYTEKGRPVFEDFKGVVGDRFRLIVKIWRNHGTAVLRITKRDRRSQSFKIAQEIPPAVKASGGDS
jgi:hypothetical protein